MKLIFFSDLHVFDFKEFSKPLPSGVPDRLQDCINILSGIREYAEENQIEHVFFGGDLFHRRGVLYTQAYNLVVAELAKYKESGINFYAVDGNHDHADKAGSVHAIQALSSAGLVHSIPTGEGFAHWRVNHKPNRRENEEVLVTGFAYCDSRAEFASRIDGAGKGYMSEPVYWIGLFHHGFKGARVGSTLEYVVKEDIEGSQLSRQSMFFSDDFGFDQVYSGHYHQAQKIEGCPTGEYIGSPLEHTRSDATKDLLPRRNFIVHDTNNRTSEDGFLKVQPPRFLTFTQEEILENRSQPMLDNLTRKNFIDVTGVEDRYLKELEKALKGARGVKVMCRITPVQQSQALASGALTPEAMLEEYIRQQMPQIRDRKLALATLRRLGKNLIQE